MTEQHLDAFISAITEVMSDLVAAHSELLEIVAGHEEQLARLAVAPLFDSGDSAALRAEARQARLQSGRLIERATRLTEDGQRLARG